MVVTVISWDLSIPGCASLKEKRAVIKSLKSRLRNKFNVSVAETAFQESWDRARITVALVATDRRFADAQSEQFDRFVEGAGRAVITGTQREMH